MNLENYANTLMKNAIRTYKVNDIIETKGEKIGPHVKEYTEEQRLKLMYFYRFLWALTKEQYPDESIPNEIFEHYNFELTITKK
jgi:hypothetical protein